MRRLTQQEEMRLRNLKTLYSGLVKDKASVQDKIDNTMRHIQELDPLFEGEGNISPGKLIKRLLFVDGEATYEHILAYLPAHGIDVSGENEAKVKKSLQESITKGTILLNNGVYSLTSKERMTIIKRPAKYSLSRAFVDKHA